MSILHNSPPAVTTDPLTAQWRNAHGAALAHRLAARFARCGCTATVALCQEGRALDDIAEDAGSRLASAGSSTGHELRHWHADDVACRGEFGAILRCITPHCGFSAPCTQTPVAMADVMDGVWRCAECAEVRL